MFLLLTTALAGTLIGWPCQRLNWGWRNVWNQCSIHAFVPIAGAAAETAPSIATGFRFYTGTATPLNNMHPAGFYAPFSAPQSAVPKFFCDNAAATGSGMTASLRNRCRRAVDAYGSLVRQCGLAAALTTRGPNSVSPDWAPQGGHQPHVSNVAGLTVAAQYCTLPPYTPGAPDKLATPSTTCPGLLGWFTVVFNACGFTNSPELTPAQLNNAPTAGNIYNFFPLGNAVAPHILQPAGAAAAGVAAPSGFGVFCGTLAPASPAQWNAGGYQPNGAGVFRTSRCRKALDQFGRTAQRCHNSQQATTGPAQAGGYSDPLRHLAVGLVPNGAPLAPMGLNVLAPLCN